jgi:hypothetical protein
MHFLAFILGPISFAQTLLAMTCLKKYPGARVSAVVLMIVAPLPTVVALFGESFLRAIHVPSSLDAIGDGFEILFQCVAAVVGTVFLSAAVCVWLSFGICVPRQRHA